MTRGSLCILALLMRGICASASNPVESLPAVPAVIDGYSMSRAIADMSTRPLHPVEGVWQMTSDGAAIAIERSDDYAARRNDGLVAYRIVLIQSPDRSVVPGTVIGYAQPSAKAGVYNARFYTAIRAGRLAEPRGFMMKVEPESGGNGDPVSLVLTRDNPKYSVDLWRMLPYMYRRVVRRNEQRESVDGCVRVYPEPAVPRFPRYL